MKASRLAVAMILLAGGWLAATAYTKRSVAQAYTDQIAKLEKRLPVLHVSGLKQEGGFFSGTFSGVMYLGCAPVGGKPHPKSLAIAFEDKVQYGPLPAFKSFGAARVESHFALTEAAPVELRAALAQLQPAQIYTDYGYGGGAHSSLVLPAGEISMGSGAAKMKMRWAELRAQATATRDATQAQYDWSLPEMSLSVDGPEGSGGGMKMLLKNMVAKGESAGQPDTWLREGKEEHSIERLEFNVAAPQQPPMTMVYDHMTSHAATQLKQGFMDVGFGYTMAGLEVQGPGQGAKLANLVLDGKVEHLDAASLEKIVTSLFAGTEMGCAAVADDKSGQPKDPRVLLGSLFKGADEAGKALMAHDPSFSIDKLAFDLNGKRGEMSMSAKLKGLDVAAMEGPQAGQTLAKAAQLQAKARVPLAWLALGTGGGDPQQTQQMADSFVAMGYAKRDGEFMTAEFSFANGVAKLNGAVFPPPPAGAPGQDQ